MLTYALCATLLFAAASPVGAWPDSDPDSGQLTIAGPEPGINWKGLFGQSGVFLVSQHAFRIATEPGTREGLKGKFWPEYGLAVGNMHGWSDADPFFVNYIGHPMQGSVSGFIWAQNDRRFYPVQFGRNRAYWESRLRAAAFSYIYSTQFELGPASEASIGKVQRYYPQQGFVDHVITPAVGMAWMIGEDAIDRFVILPLERRTNSPNLRALLRGVLNPSRTFANAMRFKLPWYRDDRPWISDPALKSFRHKQVARRIPAETPGVAPFEMDTTMYTNFIPGGSGAWCLGAGGSAKVRVAPSWQWVLDLSGCNLMGLGKNQSGDMLTFLSGAKWTGNGTGKWKPHSQVLLGVTKVTIETEDPELKRLVQARPPKPPSNLPPYPEYLQLREDSGFAFSAGGGLDYQINRALQIRLGSVGYRVARLNRISGYDLSHSLEFTAGFTLRMGTW